MALKLDPPPDTKTARRPLLAGSSVGGPAATVALLLRLLPAAGSAAME
jgi:hypothetical protein